MSSVSTLTHVQRVRILYKTCLRLHRGMPTQMQIIGDAYVKDEFKRHKKANPQQTLAFMGAWANYALTMSKQLDSKSHVRGISLGQAIKPEEIDLFTGEQLAQLFALYEETAKPQDEYPV